MAFGAVKAAVAMNLTRRSAVALGLAVVLVVGGIRLMMTTSGWVPAIAMAGVALPFLLLIIPGSPTATRRSPTDLNSLPPFADALTS
ncbi:hypothetical protein ACWENQ_37605 [Nonomuraea sp. NPDC004354]